MFKTQASIVFSLVVKELVGVPQVPDLFLVPTFRYRINLAGSR